MLDEEKNTGREADMRRKIRSGKRIPGKMVQGQDNRNVHEQERLFAQLQLKDRP